MYSEVRRKYFIHSVYNLFFRSAPKGLVEKSLLKREDVSWLNIFIEFVQVSVYLVG